jgi:acetyl-CoA carboxylase biotin carboxyl carrier protein
VKLSQSVKESLKELISIAGDEIQEVEVEKRLFGWKVRISKGGGTSVVQAVAPAAAVQAPPPAATEAEPAVVEGPSVKSPMVGTFYTSPSPDADPFVKEGDIVTVGQTVCIIEAMKIMNEIEAEVGGRVSKVLVENGAPVEYDTPLFTIDPA